MVVLLTCTVNVNADFTVLKDKETRKKQYIESIKFYNNLKNVSAIVVVENSGYRFENDFRDFNFQKPVEFLSYNTDNEIIKAKGKGYGEGEIIQYALEHSQLIQRAQYFIKITGRLMVENLNSIISQIDLTKNYFNRTHKRIIIKENKIDTRLFACNVDFFNSNLLHAYKNVNDEIGHYLEHIYFEEMKNIEFSKFKTLANFNGISGSTGESYNLPKWKYKLQSIVQKLI